MVLLPLVLWQIMYLIFLGVSFTILFFFPMSRDGYIKSRVSGLHSLKPLLQSSYICQRSIDDRLQPWKPQCHLEKGIVLGA